MECGFCKNLYKTQQVLKHHQATSKKCIAIQSQMNHIIQKEHYVCMSCKKELSTKNRLSTHILVCKKIKEESKTEAIKDTEIINERIKKMEEEIYKTNLKLNVKDHEIDEIKELKDELDKTKRDLHLKDNEIKKLKDELDKTNLKLHLKDNEINELKQKLNHEFKTEPNINKAEIQNYTFDDIIVPIRNDGMINATALCKAGKKLIGHYLENKQTKAYLDALESNIGIPILELIKVNTGGDHSGTWVHRKIGYHLAQWISPKFAVKVSHILDELFVTGSVILGKEKSSNDIEIAYQCKVNDLQHKLEQKNTEFSELLVKHNSTLKNHRYVKFNEHGSCFYIIESGILCDCKHNINRYKFGIAGTEHDTLDVRLRSHRTIWPQLKVIFIVFLKEVDILEQSIKRIYMNEINPNGHEIIEGVTSEQLIQSIKQFISALGLVQYKIMPDERIKEYNDYVTTTVKIN